MNKLDQYLEILVAQYAKDLGVSLQMRDEMLSHVANSAQLGHNTRSELIQLVKKAMVSL